MSKVNGTLFAVYHDSDKILYATAATLTTEQDLASVTTKESGGNSGHIRGLRKWSIDFAGRYDEDDTPVGITADDVMALIIAGAVAADIKFEATDGSVDKLWTGSGTIQNMKILKNTSQPMDYSGSIQGTGELMKDWSAYWTTPEFAIELETTAVNQSVTLPLLQNYGGGADFVYNFTVAWGDGVSGIVTAYNDADATHIYATPGRHIIKIAGTCESFYINGYVVAGSEATRLLWMRICGWGDVGLKMVAFADCLNLHYAPPDKTGGLALLTSADYMFHLPYTSTATDGLYEIPAGLFDYCTQVTSYHYTFHRGNFTSIPAHLFDNSTLVTTFQTCFEACYYLTSIPSGLFDYCTIATNFWWCFNDNWSLTSIPADLFKYNTAVTTFRQCFGTNKLLTSVPTDLFRYCTNVGIFEALFYGCEKLTTVPTDLFRYNTGVTTFKDVFLGCVLLTSVPADIFRYNTAVTTFERAFYQAKLSSINTDLFRYNTSVTTFEGTFHDCTSLTAIAWDVFRYNTLADTFTDCFKGCTALTGDVPELWVSHNTATGTDCFVSLTGLSNYVYIPTTWGGLGYTSIAVNGSFIKDTGWTKQNGCTISDGVLHIKGFDDPEDTWVNWGAYQLPVDLVLGDDYFSYSFRAKRISGAGNLTFGIGLEVYFDNAVTSSWTTYTGTFKRVYVDPAYDHLVFSGRVLNDEFEIDDFKLTKIVRNGHFINSNDWLCNTGSSIAGGVGIVAAKGGIDGSFVNWGIYQNMVEQIADHDVVTIEFSVKQTNGSGKFQAGLGYEIYWENNVTGSFVKQSWQFTRNKNQDNFISFGGDTNGDVFEIDDVQIFR